MGKKRKDIPYFPVPERLSGRVKVAFDRVETSNVCAFPLAPVPQNVHGLGYPTLLDTSIRSPIIFFFFLLE